VKRSGKRDGPEACSKSHRKRESESRQALGEALIDLGHGELDALDIPERLRQAIQDAQNIRKHEALRRQKQFIGRLMRDVDPEPIQEILARRDAVRNRDTRLFHAAENWRRRLVEEGASAVAECAAALGLDAESLEGSVADIRNAQTEPLRKTASRALFRTLHERIVARSADARS
jgi:ribosome-associated protein